MNVITITDNHYHCSSCEFTGSKANLSHHKRSTRHKENVEKREQEEEPLSLSGLEQDRLLKEFLFNSCGPLRPFAAAFRSGIKKAGGLAYLDSSRQAQIDEFGFQPPILFPGRECWVEEPDDMILLNDIMHTFDKTRDKVYRVGAPHNPDQEANLAEVFKQLWVPDVSCPKYAVNMGSRNAMEKPDRFIHHKIDPNVQLIMTTNITPEYTRVDLHAGKFLSAMELSSY